jgi:hypothetical protein
VVPINSSLLTITLYSSVITTLVYNDTKYCPIHDFINELDCNLNVTFHQNNELTIRGMSYCLTNNFGMISFIVDLSVVHLTMLSVNSTYAACNDRMINDELAVMWKEAIVA